jgi:hypothetical protein
VSTNLDDYIYKNACDTFPFRLPKFVKGGYIGPKIVSVGIAQILSEASFHFKAQIVLSIISK